MAKIRTFPEDFQVDEQEPKPGLVVRADPNQPFIVFRLRKKGWETQALLAKISKDRGIPPSAWGLSGLKDKRSVTTQLVSLPHRYAPDRVISGKDWELVFFGGSNRPLKSGDHQGNMFNILVRDITNRGVQLLPGRISQMKKIGIPNWFDSQRFGSASRGQLPGSFVVQGDLIGAMKIHLTGPQKFDRSSRRRDKNRLSEIWPNIDKIDANSLEYRPFARILKAWKTPNSSTDESARLAYQAVPKSLRGLWLSSWQSALWNDALREILHSAYENHLLRSVEIGVGGPVIYPEAPVGRRGKSKHSLVQSISRVLGSIPKVLEMPTPFPNENRLVHPTISRRISKTSPKSLEVLEDLKIKIATFDRETVIFPNDFSWDDPEIDDVHGSPKHKRWKCKISFKLPNGAYATNVVRRLFD